MVGFKGPSQEQLPWEIFRYGYEIAINDKKVPDPVGSGFLYYINSADRTGSLGKGRGSH